MEQHYELFYFEDRRFPRHVVSHYDLLPYYVQLVGFTSQVSFPCFSSYRLSLTELNQRALGDSYIIKHWHLIRAEFLVWWRIFQGTDVRWFPCIKLKYLTLYSPKGFIVAMTQEADHGAQSFNIVIIIKIFYIIFIILRIMLSSPQIAGYVKFLTKCTK